MAEFLTNEDKRSCYCAEVNETMIGQQICVMGWVQRQRDLGSLIFIDLRDKTGIVQLALDDTTDKEIFEKASTVKSEYVLGVVGTVKERSAKTNKIPTGDIEIAVEELRILSESETPPFEILPNSTTGELTRLKYRYLDLRRSDLQQNIILRHKIAKVTRDYFDENGFIEIETPMLIKSTPEGARDFLVPSRIHKGSFYALPQSPQIYKQLCMVAGFDRYMQIARCFRDEDLRADRQPEFTQIDMELSFVDEDDVIDVNERLLDLHIRATKAFYSKDEGELQAVSAELLAYCDEDIREAYLSGKTVEEAMEAIGSVAEGYYAAKSVKQLADREGLYLPIMSAAYDVLYNNVSPNEAVGKLMTLRKMDELGRGSGWFLD